MASSGADGDLQQNLSRLGTNLCLRIQPVPRRGKIAGPRLHDPDRSTEKSPFSPQGGDGGRGGVVPPDPVTSTIPDELLELDLSAGRNLAEQEVGVLCCILAVVLLDVSQGILDQNGSIVPEPSRSGRMEDTDVREGATDNKIT